MNGTVFYESKHGVGADYFTVEEHEDFSFPFHMHRCYEIILMLEGEMTVRIEKSEHLLQEGDMVFIKPNRIHSLETPTTSRHILCIFSPELIAAVSDLFIRYRLTSPVCAGTDPLYRELFLKMRQENNISTVKGFLYLLCGLFYPQIELSVEDTYSRDTRLLRDIFLFVEKNTDNSCTLESLAENLKYTPSHLSRFFSANVGMAYNTYVRSVKMNRACYLLRNTDDSILDIAMRCGYSSLSSFNRSFRQYTDQTPSAYRNRVRRETQKMQNADTDLSIEI